MSNTLAIVTAVTGAVVGIGGLAFGAWNAQQEREERRASTDRESNLRMQLQYATEAHARQLAHDERSYETKAKAYEDMLFALGLVLLNLEAGIGRAAQRLGLGGETPIHLGSAGLSDSMPESPRNEELLRLAARVSAFGSETVSQLVEDFTEGAYGLTKALDSVGDTPGPKRMSQARRQAMQRLVQMRTRVAVMADTLEAVEWLFREWSPDSDEPRAAWADQHTDALRSLQELRFAGPQALQGWWTYPPKDELNIGQQVFDLEHTCNAFEDAAEAAHKVVADLLDKTDDPELANVREYQLENVLFQQRQQESQQMLVADLGIPAWERRRVGVDGPPPEHPEETVRFSHVATLHPVLPLFTSMRDRLRSQMREIQTHVQAELAHP
jgi:hypothetical protein